MNKPTYHRAYAAMVDYLLTFATSKMVKVDGRRHALGMAGGAAGFQVLDFDNQGLLVPGDLILVTAANTQNFRLSWFLNSRKVNHLGDYEYLLKSVRDGEECWWSNVSLNLFTRDNLQPSWRFNDEQFAFYDQWRKVCFARNDAYLYLPKLPVFNGEEVTLSTRVRHGLNTFSPEITVSHWQTATLPALSQVYQELVALHRKEESQRNKQS